MNPRFLNNRAAALVGSWHSPSSRTGKPLKFRLLELAHNWSPISLSGLLNTWSNQHFSTQSQLRWISCQTFSWAVTHNLGAGNYDCFYSFFDFFPVNQMQLSDQIICLYKNQWSHISGALDGCPTFFMYSRASRIFSCSPEGESINCGGSLINRVAWEGLMPYLP